ncbi:uncharacterized protein EHS24_005082 [Apiotrichum porosum]|uniref:Uncharacterized protein n=1 Tax=Apiotrichum porosum TaxID=105984 RepID=A0A427Y6U5_9TREE|nr:uncharacterized protein EHS24_005082 [Apiotrichum porosum]RSH86808.1 hypothetical protein EHS24_005082 [Apiotrichum porosum]
MPPKRSLPSPRPSPARGGSNKRNKTEPDPAIVNLVGEWFLNFALHNEEAFKKELHAQHGYDGRNVAPIIKAALKAIVSAEQVEMAYRNKPANLAKQQARAAKKASTHPN